MSKPKQKHYSAQQEIEEQRDFVATLRPKPPLASFEAWWESNRPLNASSIYDSERVAAACGGKLVRVRVEVTEL